MSCGGSSLFGPSSQFIKVNAGDFIAVNGSVTSEKLTISDLRMPFKQILKSRIILKPGQANYLLNHLGLGDNATFLAIKAMYDPKSVIQDDNYVTWSFYDSLGTVNHFAQMMVLTGNNTNRVKQLYLTNPNTKYAVALEVMVAVIDDNYSFFNDNVNQTATSFTDLEYTDIHSNIVGESIVIKDKNNRPLIYFMISNINTIERDGKILTVDDNALSTILLAFKTESDAIQAHSLLTYIIENPDINIDLTNLDTQDPVVYFNATAGVGGDYILFDDGIMVGATSGTPYNTFDNGLTFSTSISISQFGGTYSSFSKSDLIGLIISDIVDNRDGSMSILPSNIVLKNSQLTDVSGITASGAYSMTFDYSDIAQNYLDGVIVNLNIIA